MNIEMFHTLKQFQKVFDKLPEEGKRIFRAEFNRTYETWKDEESCMKFAWGKLVNKGFSFPPTDDPETLLV